MSTTGPAEHAVRAYFKTRRYAGSKDRRWITEFLYSLFRRLGEVDWMAEQVSLPVSSRTRALIALHAMEKISLEEIQAKFVSGSYASDALSDEEVTALESLDGLDLSAMPAHAKENFPEWLSLEIHEQYGDKAAEVLGSYQERAPLTLRVNRLCSDREEVLRLLKEEGIEARPSQISPLGILVEGRVNIAANPIMERGLIEIQDEAAQISSLLADAKPGMQVVDYCAGAGGKSLAMAAEMENTGQIYAFDVNVRRMKDMAIRSRRSGVNILESHQLFQDERDGEIFERFGGSMNRVFVDAPCSGSGTWRRQPDQKWFFTEEKLQELTVLQREILAQARKLVAPGGRLIYATCSILRQENADQVSQFLEKHPDFSILPVAELWGEKGLAGEYDEQFLNLTPDKAGSDGFFTAILIRAA
ncbi:MAG: RsmB/NOP family class I SAM-dependent RNA methyltransferase [Sneathiella sp.]|nr:RsmB/NOP family class I SAM-dependent RNA methyltransferase [Sneathiella sp.]